MIVSRTKNNAYVLEQGDCASFEAVCVRTYFSEQMGRLTVSYKRGDRVRYTMFDGFFLLEGRLGISKKMFDRYFREVSSWREERIDEIFRYETGET